MQSKSTLMLNEENLSLWNTSLQKEDI